MTKTEMVKEIKNFLLENMDGKLKAGIIGLRYDNKEVVEGEILEPSIANWNREDDRAFPVYDENAERVNGTCIYSLTCDLEYFDTEKEIDDVIKSNLKLIVAETEYNHCSIVIGNDEYNTIDVEDEGEAIVKNCKVVKGLF